jgi:hypothetical protein
MKHTQTSRLVAMLLSARKLSLLLVMPCIAAAMLCSTMHGQTIGTGEIQGSIQDATGAVIPNATVTAKDLSTGYKIVQHTSSGGLYAIPSLPPANYTVTVDAGNFKTLVHQNVTVDALAVVTLNLQMSVGDASETVTVSTEPPQLDTTNGSLDVVLPETTYSALPLAVSGGPKNPMGFVSLLPGTGPGTSGIPALNGGAGDTSFIYINGMPLMTSELQGDARNISGGLTTEMVDQFEVETSGVPAYYEGQGAINFILKSGTNRFHGHGYGNIRNTVFDAAGYFNAKAPIEHQAEFGASVGGPILRNRLFFYVNEDFFRLRSGTTPSPYSLPTPAELGGDFSAVPTPIYDPATTVCLPSGACSNMQFPGNIIPSARITSVSKALAADLPAVNGPTPTALQNNFYNALMSGIQQNTLIGKFDYTVSQSNHAYFLIQHGVNTQPVLDSNGGAQLPLPYTTTRSNSQTIDVLQLGDTETITPNLVNTFGYQVNRFVTPFVNPTTGGGWIAKVGLTGLPASGEILDEFPPITFSGPNSPTSWATSFNSQTFANIATTTTLQDNVQWIHKKQSFTFGGQIVWQAENDQKPSLINNFGFSNNETAGFTSMTVSPTNPNPGTLVTTTGNAFASYLLGAVDNTSLTQTAVQEFGGRYRDYAIWVQDDWKLTNKLTVNLGLRYSIPKPLVEVHDHSSWFNATLPNPAVGNHPGALQFAGNGTDSCNCGTIVQTHYLTFGPRVGFAYSLDNTKVVRGSFSIIHFQAGSLGGDATSTGSGAEGAVGLPLGYSVSPAFATPDSGRTPAYYWTNPYPAFSPPPVFDSTLGTGFNTATGASAQEPTYTRPTTGGKSPYTENYNLTFEQQLTPSMSFSLSYAGSATHFIPINGGVGIYSDQVDPKYFVLGNLLTAQYSPTTLAAAQAIVPGISLPYPNFVGSIAQMLRPFPQYSGLYDTNGRAGNSHYNSLQAYLQRKMSRGLYLLVSYTWSKEIDDAGGANELSLASTAPRSAYHLEWQRSVGANNYPHDLTVVEVYQLPFGKGHMLGGNNALANEVIGGWQVSGNETYNEATPFGAISATCTVPGANNCYADYNPNFTGPIRINGGFGSGNPKNKTVYLNKNAFQNPAPFTFGTTPETDAFGLRGHYGVNENVALSKTFPLVKSVSFKFQADAFNVFNRTIMGNPNTNINSTAFGQVTGQSSSPRKLQFEGYINF